MIILCRGFGVPRLVPGACAGGRSHTRYRDHKRLPVRLNFRFGRLPQDRDRTVRLILKSPCKPNTFFPVTAERPAYSQFLSGFD